MVVKTFTFLDRNADRDVALAWKGSLETFGLVATPPCDLQDLEATWACFRRPDPRKPSAVYATSFTIMKRRGITLAYTFDHHFAMVGFRLVS